MSADVPGDIVEAAHFLAGLGFTVDRVAAVMGIDVDEAEQALAVPEPPRPAPPAVFTEPDHEEPRPEPLEKPAEPPVEVWPPAPAADERWELVRDWRGQDVGVRWVPLWGQRVRIDAAGLVFCHACARFLTPAELSRPAHGHPVGLPSQGVSEVFAVPLERAPVQYGFGVW